MQVISEVVVKATITLIHVQSRTQLLIEVATIAAQFILPTGRASLCAVRKRREITTRGKLLVVQRIGGQIAGAVNLAAESGIVHARTNGLIVRHRSRTIALQCAEI